MEALTYLFHIVFPTKPNRFHMYLKKSYFRTHTYFISKAIILFISQVVPPLKILTLPIVSS